MIILLVNPETYKKIQGTENKIGENDIFQVFIKTNNPYQIDEEIANLEGASGINYSANDEIGTEYKIESIVVYTFVILIVLFSCINIFNTVYSSIILRKREFSILKSIGMSNKQINKMLFFEVIFYGFNGIIFGLLASLAILYIVYTVLIETEIYSFYIPIKNMILCVIVSYIIILASVIYAKSKINKNNIIDDVWNENI